MMTEQSQKFKVGDKFHYPEDGLGITVDYELEHIISAEGVCTKFKFKPSKPTYIWQGQEYRFEVFTLKLEDILTLLSKGIWVPIN